MGLITRYYGISSSSLAVPSSPIEHFSKIIIPNEFPAAAIDLNKFNNNDDLSILANLIDFIQSNSSSIKPTTTVVPPISPTESFDLNKVKINEIKLKLNETKQLVKSYQLELQATISSLIQ
jgi:hypothetical protein